MNPNETPIQPEVPTPAAEPATAAPAGPKKMTGRTKLALWLLIAPSALFVVAFIAGAAIGIVSEVSTPYGSSSLDGSAPATLALGIIGTIAGLVGFITWLPGLITGIVLLATRK